jgi:tripartite-type tricarboxylate transporter receptor subunit TctC
MNYFARSVQAASLIVAGTLAALAPAKAQDFAGKQIRVIVPFNAGGGTDISARLFAQKLTESLKANVIVENKAGGNLIPAGREVAGAQPDGLTLYFISTSAIIAQALYSDYPLDLRKFAAVSEVSAGPLILVARNDLGAKTFPEIVEMAKKSPGKLKFGTGGGTASSLFLATELFKSTTGVNVNIVPYRGSGPALNDMLGGHIDAMFDFMPQMTGQVQNGKITAIAVTGAKRSPALPNVPTVLESGVKYEISGWYGILAPPGTPANIVQKLRDEVAKALKEPGIIEKLGTQGMEPRGTQPAEFAKYMQSELAAYQKIVKDANIKPQ